MNTSHTQNRRVDGGPTPGRRPGRVRRVLLVIALILAALIGGSAAVNAWLTRPQGTPGAIEFADADLSPALTSATVLALGEATHGTAEFQRLRTQLIAKLPQFRAIVMEEDYGSIARVDAYIQGGPGTAAEAASQFGFALNETEQMAEFLQWLRDRNAALPAAERTQLVGMDVQRVDASKAIALDWLATRDAATAEQIRADLDAWNEAVVGDALDAARADAAPAVDRLVAATQAASGDDDQARVARNAATTLQQQLRLRAAGSPPAMRAELMMANLERTVAEQRARGNEHTLLFGHNGHVEKTSAAYRAADLGELAARTWGDGYRVIGTEFHHADVNTGDGRNRWTVSITNPTPLRGMFAGMRVGYLDFADASSENRTLLRQQVGMGSVGEAFQPWQAWVSATHIVPMVPADAYDALVLVERATPTTMLPR